MRKPLLISLYDYSGNWARPFINAGWKVQLWDKKHEGDILNRFGTLHSIVESEGDGSIDGLLAAPPCTAFAGSGARWWPVHDKPYDDDSVFDSFTEEMMSLTLIVLHAVDVFKPKFWALENPVGRIEKLVPELKQYKKLVFQPNEYGDPYTKKTVIYGNFNTNLKRNWVEATEGSKMHKLPANAKRQELRSITPEGFAKAFYEANKDYNGQLYEQLKIEL